MVQLNEYINIAKAEQVSILLQKKRVDESGKKKKKIEWSNRNDKTMELNITTTFSAPLKCILYKRTSDLHFVLQQV